MLQNSCVISPICFSSEIALIDLHNSPARHIARMEKCLNRMSEIVWPPKRLLNLVFSLSVSLSRTSMKWWQFCTAGALSAPSFSRGFVRGAAISLGAFHKVLKVIMELDSEACQNVPGDGQ